MSGHSKWKTIQHKKGANDAKRGKLFSRLSKEILVVARAGGGDLDTNASLKTLVTKAKSANMPNDNIDRAIKKGTGELESAALEELDYEGYAAGGVALIVKALTDNKNRAASDIRHIFSKHGSSFAQQGSVSRSFHRRGQILVDTSVTDEDTLMGIVLDAGAEDLENAGEFFEITTDPTTYGAVMTALEDASIAVIEGSVTLVSDLMIPISDLSQAKAILKFVDSLEDNEDVQDVYHNADFDDSVLAAIAAE